MGLASERGRVLRASRAQPSTGQKRSVSKVGRRRTRAPCSKARSLEGDLPRGGKTGRSRKGKDMAINLGYQTTPGKKMLLQKLEPRGNLGRPKAKRVGRRGGFFWGWERGGVAGENTNTLGGRRPKKTKKVQLKGGGGPVSRESDRSKLCKARRGLWTKKVREAATQRLGGGPRPRSLHSRDPSVTKTGAREREEKRTTLGDAERNKTPSRKDVETGKGKSTAEGIRKKRARSHNRPRRIGRTPVFGRSPRTRLFAE